MKIIQVKDYTTMSKQAAEHIIDKVKQNPQAVLGLATGSTPTGMYTELIKDHELNGTSYKGIQTINLDEYVGMDPQNPNSYHYFMKTNLFDHVDIEASNTHVPDGTATDLDEFCKSYDQLIESNPIDLQVLGIGENGHIGFNEPGTPFETSTHIVTLTHSTRKANARFFNSINDVPTHAITMGIASILKSKEIVVLASGEKKAKAIQHLLNGTVSTDFPASALLNHPNVTLIVDQEAYSLADQEKRRAQL